jgi:hypothetical protein
LYPVTVTVKPSGLVQNQQTASIKLKTADSRNTAVIKITADKSKLPEPTDFLITNANPTDSFHIGKLTWTDNAESETGYIIELGEPNETAYDAVWNWKKVGETGANATQAFVTGSDNRNLSHYRIRALGAAGASSPDDAEWGNFGHVKLALTATGPAANTRVTVGSPVNFSWTTENIIYVSLIYTTDLGANAQWDTIAAGLKKDNNVWKIKQGNSYVNYNLDFKVPASADNKPLFIKVVEWPITGLQSMVGPLLVGNATAPTPDEYPTSNSGGLPRVNRSPEKMPSLTISGSAGRIHLTIATAGPYALEVLSAKGALVSKLTGCGPACIPLDDQAPTQSVYIVHGRIDNMFVSRTFVGGKGFTL